MGKYKLLLQISKFYLKLDLDLIVTFKFIRINICKMILLFNTLLNLLGLQEL